MMERLDHFMARANAAYYATHDPFADFTTSPEISQVFGELLGLWAAVMWRRLGAPAPAMFVELGPGRGTLMADALRAIGTAAPDFRAALTVHLVETSPRLRAVQRSILGAVAWHDALDSVPEGPMILLGNEFLDALPIRQFVRRGGGWTERFVGPDGFVEVASGEDPGLAAAEGEVVERCPVAEGIMAAVSGRLCVHPGTALFLDYGPAVSAAGDSLQAIAQGAAAEVLGPAGEADLTAHVDFGRLGEVARSAGAAVCGPEPQGMFLARLGLFQRTNRLARHRPPEQAMALMAGARRLAEPDRMGRLFKAMALLPPGVDGAVGFE